MLCAQDVQSTVSLSRKDLAAIPESSLEKTPRWPAVEVWLPGRNRSGNGDLIAALAVTSPWDSPSLLQAAEALHVELLLAITMLLCHATLSIARAQY